MTPLKRQREQAGWTQSDVANYAGVDIRTVRRWEAAKVPPRRVSLTYASLLRSMENGADIDGGPSSDSARPVSIYDVIQQQPDRLHISGPLSKILGHLPRERPFSILLGGASGGGKSTLALRLASTFAEHGSVLYCTSEERIDSGTIGIRAQQLGVDEDDIDVIEIVSLDQIAEQLSDGPYGFCIIDSVSELDIGPEDVIALMNDHRSVSWVLVAQANAAEKATVGGARWRHLVDIRLWCEVDNDGKRIVRNLKNRFAPEVAQITMSAAAQTHSVGTKQAKTQRLIHESTTRKDNMPDYNDWIIVCVRASTPCNIALA